MSRCAGRIGRRSSVARTPERTAPDRSATIRDALAPALREAPPGDVITLANPLGCGQVVAVVHPIAVGQDSLLVAASRRPDFPSAAERLLLGVAANQAAIAIRQWQAERALQLLNETLEQRVEAEVDGRMQVEKAYPSGAEDGGHRATDRRYRPRLQQSAGGGARQSRAAAQAARR